MSADVADFERDPMGFRLGAECVLRVGPAISPNLEPQTLHPKSLSLNAEPQTWHDPRGFRTLAFAYLAKVSFRLIPA